MTTDPKVPQSPKRRSKAEAREQLPENLRETFDQLCDEYLGWARFYYGTSLISFSILMELVADGWTKPKK